MLVPTNAEIREFVQYAEAALVPDEAPFHQAE